VDVRVRLVEQADAQVLAGLLAENREHLAPWDPEQPPEFYTAQGQRRSLEAALVRHEAGTSVPLVIELGDRVVGRVSVNDVVRGAFQSAHLGYWVSHDVTGRGVATAAVAAAVRLAFDELRLHRLQADTLVHNLASQKVLQHNGFTLIGRAPTYLRIAGRWQDCLLHQRIADPAG
jgi:ribosomal-protein-alanine N-acetyltransferase